MKYIQLAFIIIMGMLLAACSDMNNNPTVQLGDYFNPTTQKPTQNTVKLYTYRMPDSQSPVKTVIISANNRAIATLASGSYQLVHLKPGTYTFAAGSLGYNTKATLKANQTYYLALSTQTRLVAEPPGPGMPANDINAVPKIYKHTFGFMPKDTAYKQMSQCKQVLGVDVPSSGQGTAITAPANAGGFTFGIGYTHM